MKQKELIERYIYAVTRYMGKEEKDDVARELQTIIEDMLEERCGDKEADEETVKAVLNELGKPRELYEKYSSDGKDALIGAPYYGVYKYVMKVVLLCVVFGLTVAQLIVFGLDLAGVTASGSVTKTLAEVSSLANVVELMVGLIVVMCESVFEGVVFAFAAVTIWFAVMYHKELKMGGIMDTIDELPQLPSKDAVISKGSVAFGMAISLLFVTLFLACPQVLCMYDGTSIIPIFDVEYVHATWYLIVIFAVLGIGRECVKLLDGIYTKRLVIVTVVTDILSAVLSLLWLGNENIINPAFSEAMKTIFANDAAFVQNIMANFNYFFLGCIWLALALDMGVALGKYFKGTRD